MNLRPSTNCRKPFLPSDSIVSYVMDGMSDIHRFDNMIRMIDSNEWYVIENAIKLSFDEEK